MNNKASFAIDVSGAACYNSNYQRNSDSRGLLLILKD